MDLPHDARDFRRADRDAVAAALDVLLRTVHRYWYAHQGAKAWAMAKPRWAAVLCFPARRFSELNLRIAPDAYIRLLTTQLDAMRGKLRPDDYLAPTFAGQWLANWLKKEGESLYQQYRDTASIATDTLSAIGRKRLTPDLDAVAPLAQAHQALLAARRRRPATTRRLVQPTLFKLSA